MKLTRYRKLLTRYLSALSRATEQRSRERLKLRELASRVAALTGAVALTQEVAAQIQSRAHARIAQIVTRCLEAVFDDPYSFKIAFERKRGRTEARLIFERRGREVDPLSASGGGVVDVAAFAIRLACLTLSCPRRRLLLVLDEPFRFVRKDCRERVRELLETLARELRVQIVLVTHDPELRAGLVIDLEAAHIERGSESSSSAARRSRRAYVLRKKPLS